MRAAIRTVLMQPTLLQRIKRLFASNTQGLWLDCSDMSTLYQDSAGTTPVTALEQPVGLIRDKSGRGNHASQATSTKRPVLSSRVNQLLATDGDVTTYPARTNVIAAVTTIPGFTNSVHFNDAVSDAYAYKTFTHTVGVPYVLSIYVQMDDGLAPGTHGSGGSDDFALVMFGGAANAGVVAQSLGAGLYRVSVSAVGVGASINFGVVKYAANTARTFKVAGFQLETGSTATRYQRVNTATDYDSAGFLRKNTHDGTDDAIVTAAGGGASTYAAIVLGFRSTLAGAAQTLWTDRTGNTGLKLEKTAANVIAFSGGNGASINTATGDAITIGVPYVVTAIYDGVNLSVQLNNATPVTAACTLSAGQAAITMGADTGAAAAFFKGDIYEALYIKDDLQTASQIADMKRYVNGKTGAGF